MPQSGVGGITQPSSKSLSCSSANWSTKTPSVRLNDCGGHLHARAVFPTSSRTNSPTILSHKCGRLLECILVTKVPCLGKLAKKNKPEGAFRREYYVRPALPSC